MTKKAGRPKKQAFFDPDGIATAIHQAIKRDFREAQHEYCLNDPLTLYAFNRQINDFTKKYVSTNQDVDLLEAKTFEKFLSVNAHMAAVNERLKISLPKDNNRISRNTPRMEKIHKRARALMASVLGPFSEDEWFQECRNSGGSSIGVPFADTSNERKFTFPMSATAKGKIYYNRYMAFDFPLKVAIEKFNSLNPISDPYEIVESSRATTVEKNDTIRRLICVEPTCNMFLQQGLMNMMYRRMAKFGLNVETLPEQHKEKARWSSVSNENATIDWSSASDCSSIELLRWLIPPKWFEVANAVRCESTTLNGKLIPLHMFSSMGNAVTFPLETLVFWTYAHAVRLTDANTTNSLFPEWEDWMKVSVFGDDCIVPSRIAAEFIHTMQEVGFIINDEKSYYGTEQFRESCGGDYLSGFDVRPYCLKAPHATCKSALEPWLYIIANSLFKKYRLYFGDLSYVYDKELFRVLFALFRRYKIHLKLVPSFFPDDSGLKMSYDIKRFQNHYPMKLSRIRQDVNGSLTFNYLRFVYRAKVVNDDGLQYYMWLKCPRRSEVRVIPGRDTAVKQPIRKKGGYVVAKGVSGHWSVPRLSSLGL